MRKRMTETQKYKQGDIQVQSDIHAERSRKSEYTLGIFDKDKNQENEIEREGEINSLRRTGRQADRETHMQKKFCDKSSRK